MSVVAKNFQEFSKGINQHQFLEMFDEYFHDDVQMLEGGELKDSRIGKKNNREHQENFIKNAKINDIKILRSIIQDDTVVYEMMMNLEIGGHVINKKQWICQTWKDGRVIKEEYIN